MKERRECGAEPELEMDAERGKERSWWGTAGGLYTEVSEGANSIHLVVLML